MAATADGASSNRTELVWAGKRTQVERVALPFQRVETINAPRGGDLFIPFRRIAHLPHVLDEPTQLRSHPSSATIDGTSLAERGARRG